MELKERAEAERRRIRLDRFIKVITAIGCVVWVVVVVVIAHFVIKYW